MVGAEELDHDAVSFESLAMVPPVGIGGVEDDGAMVARERDGDEFSVGTIEIRECVVIGKFVKVVVEIIPRSDLNKLAMIGIHLVFQNPA